MGELNNWFRNMKESESFSSLRNQISQKSADEIEKIFDDFLGVDVRDTDESLQEGFLLYKKINHLLSEYNYDYIFFCNEKWLEHTDKAVILADILFRSIHEKHHDDDEKLEELKEKYVYFLNYTDFNYSLGFSSYDLYKAVHKKTVDDVNFDKDKLLYNYSFSNTIKDYEIKDGKVVLSQFVSSLKEDDFNKMLSKFNHETDEQYERRQRRFTYKIGELVNSKQLNHIDFLNNKTINETVLKYLPDYELDNVTLGLAKMVSVSPVVDDEAKINLLSSMTKNIVYDSRVLNLINFHLSHLNREHDESKIEERDYIRSVAKTSSVIKDISDIVRKDEYKQKLDSNDVNDFLLTYLTSLNKSKNLLEQNNKSRKDKGINPEIMLECVAILLNTKNDLDSPLFRKDEDCYYENLINKKTMFNIVNKVNKPYSFSFLGFDEQDAKEVFVDYVMSLGKKPIANFKNTFNGLIELAGMDFYQENICGHDYANQNEKQLVDNWCDFYRENKVYLDDKNMTKSKQHLLLNNEEENRLSVKEVLAIKTNFQDFFKMVSEREYEENVDLYRRMEIDANQKNFFHRFLNKIVEQEPKALYALFNNEELFDLINQLKNYQKTTMINDFLLNEKNPNYQEAVELVKNKIKNDDNLKRFVYELDPKSEMIDKLEAKTKQSQRPKFK